MKLPGRRSASEKAPTIGKRKRWISPSHRDFVRSHCCSACGSSVSIEVAHIRNGTDGGASLKPSDYFTVSLCKLCHAEQHSIGERTFWENAGIDALELAEAFAKKSPRRREIAEHKRGGFDGEE